VLFLLYQPLIALYMRKFANLCIMVWIHMDAHEYLYICMYVLNLNILCIFWLISFVVRFCFRIFSILVSAVDRSNSNNIA
jgi:hypothetical protein